MATTPGPVRVVRAVVRNPGLRRTMLAFLLFNAIEYATWIAVLVYAYAATGAASVGVVSVVQLAPAAVFAATAAALADRHPRELVLLAGYVAQAGTLALTAAAMILGAHPVIVYVLATGAACAITLTRPAQGSLLPHLARTPDELTASNGLAGSVEGVGTVVGPVAAAAILAVADAGWVFLIAAGCAAVAALLVTRLPMPDPLATIGHDPELHAAPDPEMALVADSGRRIARGLRDLTSNLDAALVVGLLGLRRFVAGALDVMYVLLAIDVLGMGESGAGILNAAVGVGSILGGALTFAFVGRRRMAPVFAGGAVAIGVSFLVLGINEDAALGAILLGIAGVGYAITDVTGRTMLQRVAEDRLLARLLGALEGIGMAAIALGSLVVPFVAGFTTIGIAVVVSGLVLPLMTALAWLRLGTIERRVHVPSRELAILRRDRILAPLPAPQLEAVARGATWVTLERGETLIREGEPGDRYFVIAAGALRITQAGRHLRDLGTPGDGLGEIALLRNVARTATAIATEPLVCLAIERAAFLQAVTGHEVARETGSRIAGEREATRPDG